MSSIYFFFGMIIFSLASIILVSAWEKRLVWPYLPEKEATLNQLPSASAHALAVATAAQASQFTKIGTFADGKGKLYRVRYDFLRSPTGDVLALISSGTVASMPVETVWLYSLLTDGHCLLTFDKQSGGEIDLTGTIEEALVPASGWDVLLRAHESRLIATACPVLPFSETNPLEDFHRFRQSRIDRLVRSGNATFLTPDKNWWRYSLKGAVLLSLRQYFTGLRRTVLPDAVRPANRVVTDNSTK